MLCSPAALGELEDKPAHRSSPVRSSPVQSSPVQPSPELAKQIAELRAVAEMREPRKEGLLAKAAGAVTAGLATSAGLQFLPGLQKLIQTINGG